MEIKNYLPQIEIDSDQLKQDLLQEKHIQLVIKQLQLNEAMIDQNLNTLFQYHRFKTNDPLLPENIMPDGYEIALRRHDDYLTIEYQVNEDVHHSQIERAFIKNYWICHLPERLLIMSKDEINFDYYTSNSQLGILKFFNETPKTTKKGIYVYGDIGIGKTYLMAAYANQMAKSNFSVCFVNMSRLLSDIKQTFNQKTDEDFKAIMSKLIRCDLLILDDIGAEAVTQWSRDEILFSILNERMEAERLTCFTSNLSKESLREFYLYGGNVIDEIKSDRLMERFVVLSDFLKLVSKTTSLRRAL